MDTKKNLLITIIFILIVSIFTIIAVFSIGNVKKTIAFGAHEQEQELSKFASNIYNTLLTFEKDATIELIPNKNSLEISNYLDKIDYKKYDLIWFTSSVNQDALIKSANENPNTIFGLVDYNKYNLPDNITSISFKNYQASFIAGYVAGKLTTTNVIGFVGGKDLPVIHEFKNSYFAGVHYANPNCKLIYEFTNSFTDETLGYTSAKKLYDQNADIVFHAASTCGNGAIQAAKDLNKFVIGVDEDQTYLAPDNVILSVIKNIDIAISNITKKYIEGSKIGGNNFEFGIEDNVVDVIESKFITTDLKILIRTLKTDIINNNINIKELMLPFEMENTQD